MHRERRITRDSCGSHAGYSRDRASGGIILPSRMIRRGGGGEGGAIVSLKKKFV